MSPQGGRGGLLVDVSSALVSTAMAFAFGGGVDDVVVIMVVVVVVVAVVTGVVDLGRRVE